MSTFGQELRAKKAYASETTEKEYTFRRKLNLRPDASVATGQRKMEDVFGLPERSVRFIFRVVRADKGIGRSLKEWNRTR